MTAMARTWDRLTLPGKALAILIPLGGVATLGLVLVIALFGQQILDILVFNLPIVRFAFAAVVLLLLAPPIAFVIIYMEMKVIALMNLRIGPDRVGPYGSLLSTVHGLKVLMKEDFTPTRADSVVFTWAPVVVFAAAALSALVLPFAPGLYGQDFNLALLYFFAVGGMTVVGLLMGGWSSFNKYSLIGGLRSAAQIVSYEIPLTLSVVGFDHPRRHDEPEHDRAAAGRQRLVHRLVHGPPAARLPDLRDRRDGRGEPHPVRSHRGRLGDRRRASRPSTRACASGSSSSPSTSTSSSSRRSRSSCSWAAGTRRSRSRTSAGSSTRASSASGCCSSSRLVPVVGTLLFAAPFYLFRSTTRWWVALILGFVLFNVAVGGLLGLWATSTSTGSPGCSGSSSRRSRFVFVFVWMRGTLPRVRIDQLMGFAWKWLLPAALLNLFVTATAVVVVGSCRGSE